MTWLHSYAFEDFANTVRQVSIARVRHVVAMLQKSARSTMSAAEAVA